MDRASIFMNGRSQAVRLPQSCRFDQNVRSVQARKIGHAVILEPVETAGWDPAYWAAVEAMPTMEEEVSQVAIPIPDVEGL
jgi:virulence-associated protein VagC